MCDNEDKIAYPEMLTQTNFFQKKPGLSINAWHKKRHQFKITHIIQLI